MSDEHSKSVSLLQDDPNYDRAIPFPARKAIQNAIWEEAIRPGDNELTTWSDSVGLAEIAGKALMHAGWKVVPINLMACCDKHERRGTNDDGVCGD